MIQKKHLDNKVTVYSLEDEPKAVAYVDIIGFSPLATQYSRVDSAISKQTIVGTLAINCFEPYRKLMLESFPRDVPCDPNSEGHKYGFWYKYIAQGVVNFVSVSDCMVFYSNSLKHLLRELNAIYGAAVVFGVPLRAGISIGGIHHGEWHARPGTSIQLYGSGLTQSVFLEKQSKKGMRIFVSKEIQNLMQRDTDLEKLLLEKPDAISEVKWWLGAFNEIHPKGYLESKQMSDAYSRWVSSGQGTVEWFEGDNKSDTDLVINCGVKELQSLGR